MAEIILHDPVSEVHGKLSKKNGRVEYLHRRNSGLRYTSMHAELTKKEKRAKKKSASSTQVAIRERFKKVVAAVRTRMSDPAKVVEDTIAFKKQKEYSTLFGFLFHEVWTTMEE